jgi:hypothetical protein
MMGFVLFRAAQKEGEPVSLRWWWRLLTVWYNIST